MRLLAQQILSHPYLDSNSVMNAEFKMLPNRIEENLNHVKS